MTKNRVRDWLPETAFIVVVIGGSLVYVIIRFWPEVWW
jgi:hypothetical protein